MVKIHAYLRSAAWRLISSVHDLVRLVQGCLGFLQDAVDPPDDLLFEFLNQKMSVGL